MATLSSHLLTAASTLIPTPTSSASAFATATHPTTSSRFSVSPFVAFLGSIIALCYRIAFWLVALVTYHIPRWTVFFLSWSGVISLEFNAVKLVLLLIAFVTIVSWTIKVRYLNRYTTLRESPLRQDEKLDLHPDVATEAGQGGINNYLDEFCKSR